MVKHWSKFKVGDLVRYTAGVAHVGLIVEKSELTKGRFDTWMPDTEYTLAIKWFLPGEPWPTFFHPAWAEGIFWVPAKYVQVYKKP